MTSITDIVTSIYPAVSGLGVPTAATISVLFDRAMDEGILSSGGAFFVTGRDYDTFIGPDLQNLFGAESSGEESSILNSPAFKGIVQGEISFKRIDLVDDNLEVETKDTAGSGLLYRTKAIFTPSERLRENTEYSVFLSGDDDLTDDFISGISERTIYDSASGLNTGNGDITLEGVYSGTFTDTYNLEITTAGAAGISKFTFYKNSDPFTTYGPYRTKKSGVSLGSGILAKFDDGTYEIGDTFTFLVKERTGLSGNMYWTFKTGSGAIVEIPTTVSTSITGDPVTSSSASTALEVSSTVPANEASHQTLPESGAYDIVVNFNNDINESTVLNGLNLTVFAESVTGETSVTASGLIEVTTAVDGPELTITVPQDMLFRNNLVTVTLGTGILDTDGNSLSEDYEFWFTTEYYPYYCTLRRIRVMIGAYIADLKNDTINIAIHLASKEADSLTWNKMNSTDEYYQFVRSQWVCCRAALILLMNAAAGGGRLKSKRLGDLEVSYDTSGNRGYDKPMEKAEECLLKWEGALLAGGRQVQTPSMVVKGELDPDRPAVGRDWLRDGHPVPAANARIRLTGYRRYRKGWWDR